MLKRNIPKPNKTPKYFSLANFALGKKKSGERRERERERIKESKPVKSHLLC